MALLPATLALIALAPPPTVPSDGLLDRQVAGLEEEIGRLHGSELVAAHVALAALLRRHDRGNEALPHAWRAVELAEARDQDDASLALAAVELARALGERAASERAVTLTSTAFGASGEPAIEAAEVLASTVAAAGDHETAIELLRKAVALGAAARGEGHPDVLFTRHLLADVLRDGGAEGSAVVALREEILERAAALPNDHRELARAHEWLAFDLSGLDETARSVEHYEAALAVYDRGVGRVDGEVCRLLSRLSAELSAVGDGERAVAIQRSCAEATGALYGAAHPATLDARHWLSDRLRDDLGDREAGRAERLAILAVVEREHGPDHFETARAVHFLGYDVYRMGRYEEALGLFERALPVYERTFGREHVETARVLLRIGWGCLQLGDYERAEVASRESWGIHRRLLGADHGETLWAQHETANALRWAGDNAAARDIDLDLVARLERTLGAEHHRTLLARRDLAWTTWMTGDPETARAEFESVLETCERIAPDEASTGEVHGQLGSLLLRLDQLADARHHLERALEIEEAQPRTDLQRMATRLSSLGVLRYKMGEAFEARLLYEEADALLREGVYPSASSAVNLANLGLALISERDHGGARDVLEESVAMFRELGQVQDPNYPIALLNLGTAQVQLAQPSAAVESYAESLARLDVAPADPAIELLLLGNYALALVEADRAEEALPVAERAVRESREWGQPLHEAAHNAQMVHALILAESGDVPRAARSLAASSEARLAHVDAVLWSATEAERFALMSTVANVLAMRIGTLGIGYGDAAEVYGGLLSWKGRSSRLALSDHTRMAGDMSASQRQLLDELQAAQSDLSRLLGGADRERDPDAIAELRRRRDALELELNRSLGRWDAGGDVDPADLVSALPPGSVLVDLLEHVDYRYQPGGGVGPRVRSSQRVVSAFVVRADDGSVTHVPLGDAAVLESLVAEQLAALRPGAGGARGLPVASRSPSGEAAPRSPLSFALVDRLMPHLDGVEHLFVVPDSFLAALPFEVLQDEDDRFLIERFRISYLQDATSLVRFPSERERSYASLLAVGGVDFDRRAEASDGLVAMTSAPRERDPALLAGLRGAAAAAWIDLPGTVREVDALTATHARLLPDGARTRLEGSDATEERLKLQMGEHGVVHLATHGFFRPDGLASSWDDPEAEAVSGVLRRHPGLLSGLVCAGANQEARRDMDDGLLTAEEVTWLDLRDVELVVLSACETALGRVQAGEGLLGLRRAFRMAGADCVISSLWSVDDEATRALMTRFYELLWEDRLGPLEALHRARLERLAAQRAAGRVEPSTWGAFVLSGDGR